MSGIGGRGRASSDRVNKIDQSSSSLGFRRGDAKVNDKKPVITARDEIAAR